MKTKFNSEEQAEIKRVMKQESVSRKTAIRHIFKTKATPAPKTNTTPNPMPITVAAQAAPAVTALPDVKSQAANDDTNKQTEAPATPKPVVPQTAAGAARGEGIRLYKLSNVATLAKDEDTTTKALFQHVYGVKRGHLMTWAERAKVVGLATAEEAAKQFMRMRGGKPQQFVKAEEPKADAKIAPKVMAAKAGA